MHYYYQFQQEKTSMNKYRIISLEPIHVPHIPKLTKRLPDNRPRTLSLRCPPKDTHLHALPTNAIVADAKKYSRKVSSLNLKQRPEMVSSKNSKRSELLGFDNRIFCNERVKSVKKGQGLPGLSRADLDQRKESHLNTYFNIRKNRLKDITKENKKIYVRINSQKSLYSSRQLNKSTDSITHSRLSNQSSQHSVSSSRRTRQSKTTLKRPELQKKEENIKIESKDINKLQNSEVNRYLNIFCNNLNSNSLNGNSKSGEKCGRSQQRGKQNKESITSGLEKILEELEQKREGRRNVKIGRLL